MVGCFEFQKRGDVDETRLAVNWKMVEGRYRFLILLSLLVFVFKIFKVKFTSG